MTIGWGTALTVWFLSGVVFWGAFVVCSLGFKRQDGESGAA